MPRFEPMPLDLSQPMGAVSARTMNEHYRLYQGYVQRCNELSDRLDTLRMQASDSSVSEMASLRVDFTFALAAIKNHESYFGVLGGAGKQPTGALAAALDADFGGFPRYLQDLKQTTLTARGWAWTVFDLDYGRLFNYPGAAQSALPVPGVMPILAIDLYGHAYFYDYGDNKAAYVEALINDIDWDRVAERLEWAQAMRLRAGAKPAQKKGTPAL